MHTQDRPRPRRGKRKRRVVRFTAGLRVDLLELVDRAWGFARRAFLALSNRRADSAAAIAWIDTPVRALVVEIMSSDSGTVTRRLLVRATPDTGALVGVIINPDGTPSCDDGYEHESWLALGRRRGSPMVRVLARRVSTDVTAAELERLAARGLARTEPSS